MWKKSYERRPPKKNNKKLVTHYNTYNDEDKENIDPNSTLSFHNLHTNAYVYDYELIISREEAVNIFGVNINYGEYN